MKLRITRTETGKTITFNTFTSSFHRIWEGLFDADEAIKGDVFEFTTTCKTHFPSKELAAELGLKFHQVM